MKTLYVSDLDGTLLHTNDRLSDFTISTLNKLINQGMHFTYATARSLNSATIVTQGLTTKIPVITYNGGFIFEAATGNILSSHFFDEQSLIYIKSTLQEHQISPFIYSFQERNQGNKVQNVAWNNQKLNEGKKRYLNLRKGDKRFHPVSQDSTLYEGDVFYVTCIGTKEELEPAYQEIRNHPSFRCIFQQELYRPEYWFEIMPKEVSKKNGILELKKLLNCDRIISFGDAINDIPMFEISDECYAVENAVPELKEIATGIIPSNTDDGVAKWLLEHAEF